MELATLNLKLSGNPNNVIVKHNVTPAELSVYASMHGEDCVETLALTGLAKERTINEEMARLQMKFTTDEAAGLLHHLYPGAVPSIPTTFKSIGQDALLTGSVVHPGNMVPQDDSASAETIRNKIQAVNVERQAQEPPTQAVPVYAEELAAQEQLDNTGGVLDLPDAPLQMDPPPAPQANFIPPAPVVPEGNVDG